MRTVLQILLTLVIIGLGYLLFQSISAPIEFQKAKKKRYSAVVERLKDIRNAQIAYKEKHGSYTGSFDSLINFVKNDSFSVVWAKGAAPDTLTEKQALEMGLIIRDTIKVSVQDSLFKAPKHPDSIRYIPFTNKEEFSLGADTLKTASKIDVHVFEAKAPNTIILNGLDRQEIVNLNAEQRKLGKYEGLRVGSLEEATNNAGNWE